MRRSLLSLDALLLATTSACNDDGERSDPPTTVAGYQAAADAEELHPGAVETVPADDPFPAFLQIAADGGTITSCSSMTPTS